MAEILSLPALIELRKLEISQAAAREILNQKIKPYSGRNFEDLVQACCLAVEKIATYLQSADVEKYREYVTQTAVRLAKQGYDVKAITHTNTILAAKLKEAVEKDLNAPELSGRKENYVRRIDVLFAFDFSMAINSLLKAEQNK